MAFLDRMRPPPGLRVLVTAGASGIGAAIARAFAEAEARVLVCDVDAAALARFTSDNPAIAGVVCDVADEAQVDALFREVESRLGGLDVLVNNAGILAAGDILTLEEEAFDRVLGVNLKGAFLVGRAAARVMVERGGGAIVNMGSVNGVLAIPNQLAYVVSKGGLHQLTRAMALALADKGVRVNAIGPGSIATDLLRQVMTDEAARKRILSRTPMGRLGEPAEVARLALFLASEEASYITGQIVYIDGGRLPLNYTVPVPE